MRKRLLLASLLVSCYCITFAQTQEVAPEKSYKNDIGFNTTFLFDGIFYSNSGPFTFMYKKYKSENKAIRLGLSLAINSNSTKDNINTSNYSNTSGGDFYLTIGKEFQKRINKWVWYGGGDLQPNYSFNNLSSFTGQTKTTTNKSSSIGIGLRPFLGIRYNINTRLYVAAEAGLSFNYNHSINYQKNESSNTVFNDTSTNSISMSMGSASGLFLFYRF